MNLAALVTEIVEHCRRYRIVAVIGDRYGGDWVPQTFAERGLRYVPAPASKAEYYLGLESLLLQGRVELLDLSPLRRELSLLERRFHPQGRVTVDHPRGLYDDLANAAALAVITASRLWVSSESDRPEGAPERSQRQRDEDAERLRERLEQARAFALEHGLTPAQIDRFRSTAQYATGSGQPPLRRGWKRCS